MKRNTTLRAYLHSLLTTLTLAISVAPSSTRGEEAVLLGLAGAGVSAADASDVLARWNVDQGSLEGLMSFAPGYPKILTRAEVPELKKGEHVVVIGFCQPGQEAPILPALGAFWPGVWSDRVKRAPGSLACPAFVQGWKFKEEVVVESRGQLLNAVTFTRDSPPSGRSRELIQLYLRRPSAPLVDWKKVELEPGCTSALSTDAVAGALRIEKRCAGASETLSFAIRGDKIGSPQGLQELAEVRAVIGGGGRTEAEAQAALERWQRESPGLNGLIELPAGHPRIVSSDDYPGLVPGYRIVLLGLCPADRLIEPMRTLKSFHQGIYTKKVEAKGETTCPNVPQDWRVASIERAKFGALELTVVKFMRRGQELPWRARAYLRDRQGVLLDWKETDMVAASERGGSCPSAELRQRDSHIVLSLECGAPSHVGALPISWTQELAYSVNARKIAVRVRAQGL